MEAKPTKIRVGDSVHRIRPIPRKLIFNGESLAIRRVLNRKGGLIVGEGDTGKSTYAQMLFEAVKAQGQCTPILVRLCTRPRLEIPDVPRGAVQTIIWDGLDEYPECAREILDLTEDLDPARYHVWVTSRPGNAASVIATSPLLEDVYHLDPFTSDDIRAIARSAQLDADAFLDAVRDQCLSSFMRKPGGAIILMQLFASGQLANPSRAELMETIMFDFARETRDGDAEANPKVSFPLGQIVDATGWLAACLVMTGRDAIWTGAKSACPANDIFIEDIPERGYDPAIFRAALALRLFEPLTSMRYRLAYSEMPAFLAGRWLAKHFPVAQAARLPPTVAHYDDAEDGDYDYYFQQCEPVDALAWASVYDTAFGKPFILKHPEAFLGAHALIAETGFPKFLKVLLKDDDYIPYENTSLLNGFDAFFDYLNQLLDSGKCPKRIVRAIQELLRSDDVPDMPASRPSESKDLPATIPTDREVAKRLTRSVSVAEMRELFRAEEARGLPYAALHRFFDLVVFKMQDDAEPLLNPKLVGCALVYDCERYLDYVVKRLPPEPRPRPRPIFPDRMTPEEVARRFKNYGEYEAYERKMYDEAVAAPKPSEEHQYQEVIVAESVCRAMEIADNMDRFFLDTTLLDLETLKRLLYALRQYGASKHSDMRGTILAEIEYLEAPPISISDDEEEVAAASRFTLAQFEALCQVKTPPAVTREDVAQIVESAAESIRSDNAKTTQKLKKTIKTPRPELTQADVARDMNVSRKTVNEWETRQTVDGPANKSNKFGYYKSLRTNPTLRPAYDELVMLVRLYKENAAKQKMKNKRAITFERFNELYRKHNRQKPLA